MTDVTVRHLVLDWGACTSCMACVRECPSWCVELRAHSETEAAGGRVRRVLALDSFVIDFMECLDCGICVDVCAPGALTWEWDAAVRPSAR